MNRTKAKGQHPIKFAQNYSRTKKTRRNAKYDTKNECRNEFQIRRTIGFFAWQSFYDVIDNKLWLLKFNK